ncbi:MAG: hypothetical protein U0P46_03445 [Holophagaceae bacterium]
MSRFSTSIAFLLVGLAFNQVHGQSIGSGHPGMKVVTGSPGSVAIYQDEPHTFGVGLMGGWKDRQLRLVVDEGYNFDKSYPGAPKQLFPFDKDTAFSCSGGSWTSDFGRWDYSRRKSVGYRLIDGRLSQFEDVQRAAAVKYHLSSGEEFLGFIGNKVFYWKGFDPTKVFWRDQSSSKTYFVELPKGVIDLFGAASGIKKDIAILAFSKSRGWFHYSPYTDEVIEIKLSKGVEFAP